jgi:hypothetical protein
MPDGQLSAATIEFEDIGEPEDYGPNRREGRIESSRRRCGMRRARINKKPQAVAARLRCRQRKQALPLDLRDPDVVRAKDLQRKLPP